MGLLHLFLATFNPTNIYSSILEDHIYNIMGKKRIIRQTGNCNDLVYLQSTSCGILNYFLKKDTTIRY